MDKKSLTTSLKEHRGGQAGLPREGIVDLGDKDGEGSLPGPHKLSFSNCEDMKENLTI